MRVLVTGGAGFLGRHLVAKLIAEGHDVTIFDDLSTSIPGYTPPTNDNQRFIYGNVADNEWFYGLGGFAQIYHLACPASPPFYQANHRQTLDTCYLGTRNVLMLAKKCESKVLIASTSEVYGDPDISPQPESYRGNVNTFGPRACYDEGKRAGEALAYATIKDGFLRRDQVVIARIFNTYGPGMRLDDGRMIPEFFKAALADTPIPVNKRQGEMRTRSLCYVDDTVRGLMLLMQSRNSHPIYNVGSSWEHDIEDIARMVISTCGSRSRVEYKPPVEDDPHMRKADTRRIREELHWAPQVNINDGLAMCLPYFKGATR